MHEMSIVSGMIEIVREQMAENGARKLRSVKMRVGELTAVEPDSLRFCFKACTDGTDMEGAVLDIEEVPVTGRCERCGNIFRLDRYLSSPCPKCGGETEGYLSGRELDIVSMEVD